MPYFRYFGPTAIVPGYKQMVVSVRDKPRAISHSAASPSSTASRDHRGGLVAGGDTLGDELPKYDLKDPSPVHPLIISLVKTFFVHLGCNYPFLKQEKFLRMVKEKSIEPILVDAVCALSARFSDLSALSANGRTSRSERGQIFAQRAKQATVDTFPAPSVGAVQGCLLMAYEGFGADQDSALWMYLGLAIRMAVDLGLQKRIGTQYHGEQDPWYTQQRSRKSAEDGSPESTRTEVDPLTHAEQREIEQERTDTFWAVFFLDRVISSGTGRPVTFREDDLELAFPKPHLDPTTGWPAPFPSLVEIILLYGRASDILNNVHDIRDLTQEKWERLRKMEHQLTRVYKAWDPKLQFNVNNFKAYSNIGQGTTFILLHFWFHTLFIILHQPTLMTPFGDLKSDVQLLADSRELSMSSAKTICDILSFADLIDPNSFVGNPFTSQPIYIAACAFLMESSRTASTAPSREGTPPQKTVHFKSDSNRATAKSARHSLLASAANQNYQRCYSSLQLLHEYWGGIKYILTALDQKSKGIWDVETYTQEDLEGADDAPGKAITRQFPFEHHASPRASGPPIAWSLAGTANSPNSNLTLMYQNPQGPQGAADKAGARVGSTPPGNTLYDPVRRSVPETSHMGPPELSRVPGFLERQNRPVVDSRSLSNTTASDMPSYRGANPDAAHAMTNSGAGMPMAPPLTPGNQAAMTFDTFGASSATVSTESTMQAAQDGGGFYGGYNYQSLWGMGSMGGITFDSQDIDIGVLGLQRPDLMDPWLDYIPGDVSGLYDDLEVPPP